MNPLRTALLEVLLDPQAHQRITEAAEVALILGRQPYLAEVATMAPERLGAYLGMHLSAGDGADTDEVDEVLAELQARFPREEALAIMVQAMEVWEAEVDRQEAAEAAGEVSPAWNEDQRVRFHEILQDGHERVLSGEDLAVVAARTDAAIEGIYNWC